MKRTLQKEWQKKYEEWMSVTEEKIKELQKANDMLHSMMGREAAS